MYKRQIATTDGLLAKGAALLGVPAIAGPLGLAATVGKVFAHFSEHGKHKTGFVNLDTGEITSVRNADLSEIAAAGKSASKGEQQAADGRKQIGSFFGIPLFEPPPRTQPHYEHGGASVGEAQPKKKKKPATSAQTTTEETPPDVSVSPTTPTDTVSGSVSEAQRQARLAIERARVANRRARATLGAY